MSIESSSSAANHGVRLLTLPEVIAVTHRSRSRIYAGIKAGEFPAPVKDGVTSRWVESEVHAFIARLIAERDSAGSAA